MHFLLAYFGGALTLASPYILPVLTFAFSLAGQLFLKRTLPILAGMAVTFGAIVSLAAIGGGLWRPTSMSPPGEGALTVLAGFGFLLVVPAFAQVVFCEAPKTCPSR